MDVEVKLIVENENLSWWKNKFYIKFYKKRMKKLFVLNIFKLKPDVKYKSILSKFECLHKYISVYCRACSLVKVIMSYWELY